MHFNSCEDTFQNPSKRHLFVPFESQVLDEERLVWEQTEIPERRRRCALHHCVDSFFSSSSSIALQLQQKQLDPGFSTQETEDSAPP
ncbi:hypothetical protein U1Q18_044956, partial [Sarracenia purpurea var. burkii]